MTLVMGVLNVTPDSFSDGGEYDSVEVAVAHGVRLAGEGAAIVDVGGESTRPGAVPVSEQEEMSRVLPVIEGLVAAGVTVSVDTLHAETARKAVSAGASYVNDVSGGQADPEIATVVAETGAGFIVGHWRGIPDPHDARSRYDDVVRDVTRDLEERTAAVQRMGVHPEKIIVDPGLGFDKTDEQGWRLLAAHDALQSLGFPVLFGISRKRMLGSLLAGVPGAKTGPGDRDLVTAVTSALIALTGAWGVRVHAVHPTMQALAVVRAWREGTA